MRRPPKITLVAGSLATTCLIAFFAFPIAIKNVAVLALNHIYRVERDLGKTEIFTFDEILVGDNFDYAYGIEAFDADMDGDIDIAATDADNGIVPGRAGGHIYLFENDGAANFTQRFIAENVRGPKLFRGRPTFLLERLDSGDLNGDGRPDLAVVDLVQDRVLKLIAPSWSMQAVPAPRPVEIQIMDGQLLTGSWEGGVFLNGEAIYNPPHWDDTREIVVADLTGDGLDDIIASDLLAGEITLLVAPSWTAKTIVAGLDQPWHGQMTPSGYVFGTADGIMRLSDGEVTPLVDVPREHNSTWHTVAVADLDGDGTAEIIGTVFAQREDGIGGLVVVFSGDEYQVLKTDWRKANDLAIADLNGDGLLDIVAATENPHNEVRAWLLRD